MKEKIRLLSKGKLDYVLPELELSESELELEVEAGRKLSGAFEIRSLNGIAIRAMIFSSSKWMKCLTSSIVDTLQGSIQYEFDSAAYAAGDYCEGEFIIVTNGDQITVPYRVHICAPFCVTSAGRINDLDRFADLARDNWSEALAVFTGSDFKRVFLSQKRYAWIYDSLVADNDPAVAMEEFLCTVKRKSPPAITVSQDMLEFDGIKGPVSGTLLVQKTEWGYIRINIRTEGDFIHVFRKTVTDEDFLGSYYRLEYEITPTSSGITNGSIILETMNQTFEIPVAYSLYRKRRDEDVRRRVLLSSWHDLGRSYADYVIGSIDLKTMLSNAREDLDGILNNTKNRIYRVVEAHVLYLEGKSGEAKEVIDAINGQELRYVSAVYYGYYLYVNSLIRADEHYTLFIRDTIDYSMRGQYADSWELAVIMARLRGFRGSRAEQTYKYFKDVYNRRETAPGAVFYAYAVNLINEDPSLVHEIDDFEVSVLIWGTRNKAFSNDAVYQFADLIEHMREYSAGCAYAMGQLCPEYQTKPILAAYLHMLILGGHTGRKYRRWYLLGIESELKLPLLYESYIDTLDLREENEIPAAVLVYFQYDNHLDDRKKAFLYSYIVRHYTDDDSLMRNYDDIIKTYTFEKLRTGQINSDLAVLYGKYLTRENLSPHMAPHMTHVIFKQKITFDKPAQYITKVMVEYSEVDSAAVYPVADGEAYVDIYLDDYLIIFLDDAGNKYMSSVSYTMQKLFDNSRYIRYCYEQCPNDEMILLGRSERALKYQMMDDDSIGVYKRTLGLKNVSAGYRRTILKNLIDYYYDSYEGETLEKYLLRIDIDMLDGTDRSSIIEYYIQRSLYDKAYEAIRKYGYDGIPVRRILRLASRIIRDRDFEEDALLIELSYEAFSKGKYDEVVLNYLIRYYSGPVENLFRIWKASKEFEISTAEIEEKLLCEMLFTEKMVEQSGQVFASYYDSERSNSMIVRAYLAFYAYRMLCDENMEGSPQVLQIMEIEQDQLENAGDVVNLAVLRYYASGHQPEKAFYGKLCARAAEFVSRGIVLPFFTAYENHTTVPAELVDLTYVTYIAHPGCTADIAFQVGEGEDAQEREVPMRRITGNIFVYTFRLYDKEKIRCRILEIHDGQKTAVHEETVRAARHGSRSGGSGFEKISRMQHLLAAGDDQKLDEALMEYDRFDEQTDGCFELI